MPGRKTKIIRKGSHPKREYGVRLQDLEDIDDYQYYLKQLNIESGYKSRTDYLNHLAKSLGFKSATDYNKSLWQKKGFKTQREYQVALARKKGFKKPSDYQKFLALKRTERTRNKRLAELIRTRLKELNKNQSWLANKIGKSRTNISLYARGLFYPKEKTLRKIKRALLAKE